MADLTDIRETVRERYAAAARGSSCCGKTDASGAVVFGGALYGAESGDAPAGALSASLGCGVPTAVADLHEGETVLDLGSGAGADVLISARRVGPGGRAIGLDMTAEMLALARANAAAAGVDNAEFLEGYLEDIPLPDGSVDVVISNCVINLAADKRVVLREAARVLRPGGRLAVSDVIAADDMDEATRTDMAAWTGCVAGALTEAEFREALATAGFEDVEIRPTHQVHELASSAIIRARKPAEPGRATAPAPTTPAAATQAAELPVVGCGLDDTALAAQLDRYRMLAAHVAVAERGPSELRVEFAPSVDRALLEETIALERGCCSFFGIDLEGDRLRIAVANPAQEAALSALADALGA
jgi:SAM-dependent methyltransferase